ncbi:MAG: winged helix-turn-helix domain-containing protein [Gammaproteobacteria bacterium]|jgi:predicted transcriptional regulator|nr:winged helix-turn-helix domain-containing protein [Gammaproteobacteria bacterium]
MEQIIGDAAGKIWKYLQNNGATSTTKLASACELDIKLVQRAIGWLAREDKLMSIQKGRIEVIDLKES